MVNITKWVLLGGALIMMGLFTKEAAQTSLTGTLQRTGMAGGHVGSALSSVGSGVGDLFRGLFTPLWEVGNFAKSFGFGLDYWGNSTPDPQASTQRIELTGQGGGFSDAETQGGGDPGFNTDPIGDQPVVKPKPYLPQSLNPFYSDPSIATYGVTDVTVHGQNLPLGAEAVQYYRNLGVSVTAAQPGNSGGGLVGEQGGGTWGTNVTTASGGLASGNLSLSNWGA
jgi:hypothetical protein